MKSTRQTFLAVCVALAAGASGCAASRVYALPMPPAEQAAQLYQPLLSCATAQNYASERHMSTARVEIDPSTTVTFDLAAGQDSKMTVNVNDSHLTDADVQAKFANAKAKADELLECAKKNTLSKSPEAPPT